ncbi:hypothetical protein BSNK01_17860 [Bacillaceae bacterium]
MSGKVRVYWEELITRSVADFFHEFNRKIDEQEIASLRTATEFLTGHIFYLLESNRVSAFEELHPYLQETIRKIVYLRDKKPGLLVLKGRLETLEKLVSYSRFVTPDVTWMIQLKGKYDESILIYLYMNNVAQMSRIAHELEIVPSQLTPIIERLEQDEFLYREREGKNVWCRLTKKGFLLGKYLFQKQEVVPLYQAIREITHWMKRDGSIEKLEKIIEGYQSKYPIWDPFFHSLKELGKKMFHYTSENVGIQFSQWSEVPESDHYHANFPRDYEYQGYQVF